MKDLKETKDLMVSSNYQDRFIAEYWQLKIRYEKLKNMCDKWDSGKLDFTPTCQRFIYDAQLTYMESYMHILQKRAELEKIDLLKGEKENEEHYKTTIKMD